MPDEYEFDVVQVPMDENIQAAADDLRQEGWVLNPAEGPPKVTWHIMRKIGQVGPVPFAAFGIKAEMKMNEDLVFVGKADGRVLRKDGSEVPGGDIDAELERLSKSNGGE